MIVPFVDKNNYDYDTIIIIVIDIRLDRRVFENCHWTKYCFYIPFSQVHV